MKIFGQNSIPFYKKWGFLNTSFILFSYILISMLMVVLYIPYSDGINVNYGDNIDFGFYNLHLLKKGNVLSLNWFCILLTIFVIIDVFFGCYNFWIYKRSNIYLYTKKYTVSFLYFFVILLLVFLLFINFMNRDIINLRDKDIVLNGYWNDVNADYEWLAFNYTYDIVLARYSQNDYVVNWVINKFGISWLTASIVLMISIFISNLVYLYFKNKILMGKWYGK